jgi:hypothetical protein
MGEFLATTWDALVKQVNASDNHHLMLIRFYPGVANGQDIAVTF